MFQAAMTALVALTLVLGSQVSASPTEGQHLQLGMITGHIEIPVATKSIDPMQAVEAIFHFPPEQNLH